MKKLITVLSLSGALLLLAGCGTAKKEECTINIHSHHIGWGEDGNFLGEGEADQTLTVREGTKLYENWGGEWLTDEPEAPDLQVIAEIKSIEPDCVVCVMDGQQVKRSYGSKCKVDSLYTVYDGTNYDYMVYFSDYREK